MFPRPPLDIPSETPSEVSRTPSKGYQSPVPSFGSPPTPSPLPKQRMTSLFGVRETEQQLDKFTKENFDLKLKIKFLEEAMYTKVSDEGIKETIRENSFMRKKLLSALEEVQMHRGQVNDRIKELTNENEELAQANKDAMKEGEKLMRKNEKLVKEKEDLRRAKEAQTETLTAQAQERRHLRERIDDLNLQLTLNEGLLANAADEEVWQAKYGELQDHNAALQLQNQDYAEQVRCLMDQLEDADLVKAEFQKLQEAYAEQSFVLDDESHSLHETVIHVEDELRNTVAQQESSQTEIMFLREEQEGLMIKIGQLEDFITNLEKTISIEKKRVKVLNARLTEERNQREVSETEALESQKMVNDLNHAAATARENSTKLKRRLSCTELEAKSSKQQISDLEQQTSDLEQQVKDLNARLSQESQQREVNEAEKLEAQKMVNDLNQAAAAARETSTKLKRRLSCTELEANSSKHQISDLEQQLKDRDALLETHGLESKKLSDLLDRERQGRRVEKAQHDQLQKTTQYTSRTVAQKDLRIGELEASRQTERKKLATLEQVSKDALNERNELLLTLWKGISTMCGSDWQHQNNLVNNHLPTVEVVSNMLPDFSRNLLAALETAESALKTHQASVGNANQDLLAIQQALEKEIEARSKKVHELEAQLQAVQLSTSFMTVPELAKLRGENRLLKSELARVPRGVPAESSETSEQRWLHRLREMERRVKMEREARLLDRAGARRRLQENEKEMEELKAELVRERNRDGRSGR